MLVKSYTMQMRIEGKTTRVVTWHGLTNADCQASELAEELLYVATAHYPTATAIETFEIVFGEVVAGELPATGTYLNNRRVINPYTGLPL